MRKALIIFLLLIPIMSSAQNQLMTKPGAKFYLFYGDETSEKHIYAEPEYYKEYRKPKKVRILNFASVNDSTLYDAYIVESAGIKYLIMSEDIQDNALLDKKNKSISEYSRAPVIDKSKPQNVPSIQDKPRPKPETSQDISEHAQKGIRSHPYINVSEINYGTTRITARSRYASEREAYTEVLKAMKICGVFPGTTNDRHCFLSSEWKATEEGRINYKINMAIYSKDGQVYIDFSGKYTKRSSTSIFLLIFGFQSYNDGMRQAIYSRDAFSQDIFGDILSIINRLDIYDYEAI